MISIFFFRNPDVLIMVENDKSHGSISVRYGAIIFGIGRKKACTVLTITSINFCLSL